LRHANVRGAEAGQQTTDRRRRPAGEVVGREVDDRRVEPGQRAATVRHRDDEQTAGGDERERLADERGGVGDVLQDVEQRDGVEHPGAALGVIARVAIDLTAAVRLDMGPLTRRKAVPERVDRREDAQAARDAAPAGDLTRLDADRTHAGTSGRPQERSVATADVKHAELGGQSIAVEHAELGRRSVDVKRAELRGQSAAVGAPGQPADRSQRAVVLPGRTLVVPGGRLDAVVETRGALETRLEGLEAAARALQQPHPRKTGQLRHDSGLQPYAADLAPHLCDAAAIDRPAGVSKRGPAAIAGGCTLRHDRSPPDRSPAVARECIGAVDLAAGRPMKGREEATRFVSTGVVLH